VTRLAFLPMLAMFVLPAFASTRLTVAELEQRLATDRGKSDAELAQRLSDLELTERLSTASLERLRALSPGIKSTQALKILADESSFLALPAAEIPAVPAPDVATQRQIMGLVVSYVSKTIHQLPNFYATRVTTHFEETPQDQTAFGTIKYQPLHQTSVISATVLYREGQEIVDKGNAGGKAKASQVQTKGLRAWGIFGPILSTVILDAARSNLSWSHWEQGATGTQAVFRYAVPVAKSHYRVNYCCVPGYEPGSDLLSPFDRVAAYHGEIAVDPHTGSILRLTLQAELKPTDPVSDASIMVEYGPVSIGGQTYICAKRSVAFSQALSPIFLHGEVGRAAPAPLQRLLNDISFEQYHMFRSDVRILTGEEANHQEAPSTAPEAPAAPNEVATAPAATQELEKAASQPTPDGSEHPDPGSVSPAASAPVPAAGVAANDPQESRLDQTPVFKTTTRNVIVDVVVTKGNGEPVLGLGKQDFEVSENGKTQAIDFFEEHSKSDSAATRQPEMPAMPAGMHTNVPPAASSDAVNLLLIDTLNTSLQDQTYVRRQVLEFLSRMQPGTRMAIFMLGSKLRCLQGFTSDASVLLAALHDPRNGFSGEKSTFLKTSGDQANDAGDIGKLEAMRASPIAIEALRSALADAGMHDLGARASMTFEALIYLGHYLAGIPGRKNLVWFAGSFPVAIFPTADQMTRGQNAKPDPDHLPSYVDRLKETANLFTTSQIAVYPISAEGMMIEHLNEADSAGPGASAGIGPRTAESQSRSPMSPFNESANGRTGTIFAMEQLAGSTGGKAYYNGNDLDAEMRRAIDDGAHYYTIGYSPADRKMDGRYRRLDVKLTHGKGKLAYRHGYIAGDVPAAAAQSGIDPLPPLLRLGLPAATGVLYGVSAEPSAVQPSSGETRAGQNSNLKGPVIRYTVNFVIRSQDLSFASRPQGDRSGKLLLGLKVYDRDGNALNWGGDVETLEMKPDQYESIRKAGISAHMYIDLPIVGDVHLVTAVYDLNGAEAGTLEIPLQVTAPGHGIQQSSHAVGNP